MDWIFQVTECSKEYTGYRIIIFKYPLLRESLVIVLIKNNSVVPTIAGLAVGISLVLVFSLLSPSLSILYSDAPLTMTGDIVCLPHKKGLFDGFETSECAIGFAAQNGKYYGFDSLFYDEKLSWLFDAQGSGELVNVTGVVGPASDDFKLYDVAGVIDITSARRADGTVSIYEVYHRYYDQLSEILDVISKRTGGGYSIGVDTGCDDLEQASEGGESCILILLDNDFPELSSKIPHSLEGFKVYVSIFENS